MPIVRFAPGAGRPSFAEGAEYARLTLTLSEASSQEVTATVRVSGLGESDASDLQMGYHTVTFLPGRTSADLWVRIWGDGEDEADETFDFEIVETTNASRDLSDPSSFRVAGLLVDDDMPAGPTVRFAPGTGSAGFSEGAGYAELVLELSEASTETVSAIVFIWGSEAQGDDIDFASKTAVFAPGETRAVVRVPIVDDRRDEADEAVTFRIGNVTNASRDFSGDSTFLLPTRIVDNDAPVGPTVRFAPGANLVLAEDGGHFELTLVLSQASAKTVLADVGLGGDYDHSDLDPSQLRATFLPGQTSATVRIPVNDDGMDEVDAKISFEITNVFNVSRDHSSLEAYRLAATILDNDAPPAQQVGTAGGDVLTDTAGSDLIRGLGGDDVIRLAMGDDSVDGGDGKDLLVLDWAEGTADVHISAISVGAWLMGQFWDRAGRTANFSGIEGIEIYTGSGNDQIMTGGYGRVETGAGDDRISIFGREVSADGGSGQDSLQVDLGWATTAIRWNIPQNSYSGPGSQTFTNFEALLGVVTGSGDDRIETGRSSAWDYVTTGAGNDEIILYGGRDGAQGGEGDDVLIVDWSALSGGGYHILTGFAAPGAAGALSLSIDHHVEFGGIERLSLFTGSGLDRIEGSEGAERLDSGGGDDVVNGGGGDDVVDGGIGDDLIKGGAGNDRVTGGQGSDVVDGGAGNDVLHLWHGGDDTADGGDGGDIIFFGAALDSSDRVNGGGGNDTLVLQGPYGALTLTANVTQIENVSILGGSNRNFGEPGTNRYDYVLTVDDSNFAAGVQARINAAALLADEDFTFDGRSETDALFVVYGGKGKDSLTGGLGNDIFFYAEERFASGDVVDGGSGYDGMFLRGNYTIDFNAPGYAGLFTNIENLTLTSATDERYARGGGTEFDYDLTLSDAIVGAGQLLTISGSLLMSGESMILDAGQESDGTLRLFGGKANDVLKGGAQADLIHGNLGADLLAGNGGADTFRYDGIADSNAASRDHILDFAAGTDKIDLSRVDSSSSAAGDQAFSWIGSDAFSGSAGQLRAYEQNGTWFVEGDTDGDSVADLVIALTLQGPAPLGAGDFLL
jgi:Ca2+-binding RTX toxin-like protein